MNEALSEAIDNLDAMSTEQLLFVIYTAKNRAGVVPAYRKGIVEGRTSIDWGKVNLAITTRWSSSALTWIKTEAWRGLAVTS